MKRSARCGSLIFDSLRGGNTTGSASQDSRFPDDRLAIIVLSNAPYCSYNATEHAIYKVLVPQPASSGSAVASPISTNGNARFYCVHQPSHDVICHRIGKAVFLSMRIV
jgi:hypothetical protein